MKNFDWSKPITRKDYATLCGWAGVLALMIYGVGMMIIYKYTIEAWIEEKIENFKKRFS